MTNILVSSTQPLNVFFNQTNPATGVVPLEEVPIFRNGWQRDAECAARAKCRRQRLILSCGARRIISVAKSGVKTTAALAVFEVDFNITALTNDVPFNDTLTNGEFRYFSFDVSSSNAYEATFQLLRMSGNADLVVSKGTPLPTLTESDYGSFNSGPGQRKYLRKLTNSSPVPLSPGTWHLGVFNRDDTTNAVNYTVLAQELDIVPGGPTAQTNITFIPLTNGVPFDYTAGQGAALTNFFTFTVTNTITPALTNIVGSIHFELYNLTGNGDFDRW